MHILKKMILIWVFFFTINGMQQKQSDFLIDPFAKKQSIASCLSLRYKQTMADHKALITRQPDVAQDNADAATIPQNNAIVETWILPEFDEVWRGLQKDLVSQKDGSDAAVSIEWFDYGIEALLCNHDTGWFNQDDDVIQQEQSEANGNDLSYLELSRVTQHLDTKTEESLVDFLSCEVCNVPCKNRRLLRNHRRSQHFDPRRMCSACCSVFDLSSALKTHRRIRYKCFKCKIAFCLMSLLQYHQVIEHGKRGHVCHECRTFYSTGAAFKKHNRDEH